MLKLGITGGIGSGKSIVSSLFGLLGVPVFDSDKEARQLIDTDPLIEKALKKTFGTDIYFKSSGLDRKKLGSIVFNDKKALEKLNQITHPPVIAAAKNWMDLQAKRIQKAESEALNTPSRIDKQSKSQLNVATYVIKEAALLFESGTAQNLDFILGVYAPEQIRIQRVIQRDGTNLSAVKSRISKQMDETEKMKACDGVIINDGKALLWPQVLAWHAHFMALKSSQLGARSV